MKTKILLIAILFGFAIGFEIGKNSASFDQWYWNQVILTEYIAEKSGYLVGGGGGTGNLHNDTYMIECEQNTVGDTAYNKCCEGEIRWTIKYVDFEWIDKRCDK